MLMTIIIINEPVTVKVRITIDIIGSQSSKQRYTRFKAEICVDIFEQLLPTIFMAGTPVASLRII